MPDLTRYTLVSCFPFSFPFSSFLLPFFFFPPFFSPLFPFPSLRGNSSCPSTCVEYLPPPAGGLHRWRFGHRGSLRQHWILCVHCVSYVHNATYNCGHKGPSEFSAATSYSNFSRFEIRVLRFADSLGGRLNVGEISRIVSQSHCSNPNPNH
jgi:hypothetical protein